MTRPKLPPVAIEPFAVQDCLVTGVSNVVFHGGLVRVTLYYDRLSETGEIERIIVGRVVMTEADYIAAIEESHAKLKEHIARQRTGGDGERSENDRSRGGSQH